MTEYILKRIALMLLLLIGMSFIVFGSMYIAPGDPAAMVAGPSATEADVENIRVSLGLDKPFLVQYLLYLKRLMTLDLGTSYTSRQPILDEILVRLPHTLNLACAAMIISVVLGVPAGILTALHKDSFVDNMLTTSSLILLSIPNFLLGVILMYFFAVRFKLLPVGGMEHYFWTKEGFREALLPAFALATGTMASFIRLGRSAMLDVLQTDYIRTAKAKGLRRVVIIYVHAFRNALIPLVTQFGTSFGGLLGGAIITEQVFVINGIGTYLINSIRNYNYPVVQSTVLVIAAMFIIINLIVDILYCVIDPRIKLQG
jgi:peptide/nickel transport system permease protein